ncbi:hypothetical protein Asp14428_70770 [Actinoplanes sp. NBRC 14428]|nr:hypothetical protein Asp14428_70770 [Actinoplanes sp. NBRC 14428]
MTYRVDYNGEDAELATLDAALDTAKEAIAADVGPVSGWAVEHDETINDWFVQGVLDGKAVGATAVVSGPEPTTAAQTYPRPAPAAGESAARCMTFTGATPPRRSTWPPPGSPGGPRSSRSTTSAGTPGVRGTCCGSTTAPEPPTPPGPPRW